MQHSVQVVIYAAIIRQCLVSRLCKLPSTKYSVLTIKSTRALYVREIASRPLQIIMKYGASGNRLVPRSSPPCTVQYMAVWTFNAVLFDSHPVGVRWPTSSTAVSKTAIPFNYSVSRPASCSITGMYAGHCSCPQSGTTLRLITDNNPIQQLIYTKLSRNNALSCNFLRHVLLYSRMAP